MKNYPHLPLGADFDQVTIMFRDAITNQKTGCLRATKVKVPDHAHSKHKSGYLNPSPMNAGEVAYVWRMVAFSVSPNYRHHCMPVCADFDVPDMESDDPRSWKFDQRRQLTKNLDVIADRITNAVPKAEWHGISRWARALGHV